MSTNGSAPTPQEARDQVADDLGFAAAFAIDIGNGESVEIPYPGLLDDDQQQRYNELQAELEDLDTDDVPLVDDEGVPVLDADGNPRVRKVVKEPHRRKGKLLEPYTVRLCKALFGEAGYARLKAAGVRANDINAYWIRMHRQYEERLAADSKSAGSTLGVASVSRRD